MISFKSLLGVLVLGPGLSLGLSASAHSQDSDNDAANSQSEEQLVQLFGRLDTNADGALSLEEFQQMRGAGRGMTPSRGERMAQMTPEQREQMRERRQQGQGGGRHDHGEP